jgi:hypothetical protein
MVLCGLVVCYVLKESLKYKNNKKLLSVSQIFSKKNAQYVGVCGVLCMVWCGKCMCGVWCEGAWCGVVCVCVV